MELLRPRAAFGGTRLLRTPVLRRGAFAGWPPPLERRLIAAPGLKIRYLSNLAHLEVSGDHPDLGITHLRLAVMPVLPRRSRGHSGRRDQSEASKLRFARSGHRHEVAVELSLKCIGFSKERTHATWQCSP